MPQQNIINIGGSVQPGIQTSEVGLNPTFSPGIAGTVPPYIPPKLTWAQGSTSNPTGTIDQTISFGGRTFTADLRTKTSFIADPYTVNITSTNITKEDANQTLLRTAGRAAATFLSIPSVISTPLLNQIGSGKNAVYRQYTSLPIESSNKLPVDIQDFRSRLTPKQGSTKNVSFDFGNANSYLQTRLDGASALLRGGGGRTAAYAAASAAPGGAYTVFGRNKTGGFGYGMGDPGDPHALRNDFTARSQVATKWKKEIKPLVWVGNGEVKIPGSWGPTSNPLEMATPFRGDKVNVIDFSQRKLSEAYLWKPNRFKGDKFLGKLLNKANVTNDFIKFIMTGPSLTADQFKNPTETDDIFAFRCTDLTVSDSFNAAYTAINMIGRADPNYHYGGYTRDVSVGFTVHATDRDELKPIWRKLNFLAGYTTPEYNPTQLGLTAPWMRITIGDLFVQQPVLISSLGYELAGTDTSWEINIEGDPTNMQVPHSVKVSMTLYMITDSLPQKGGRMYTLAKSFKLDKDGLLPVAGNDNWLSEAKDTAPKPPKEMTDKQKERKEKSLSRKQNKAQKKLNRDKEKNKVTAKNYDVPNANTGGEKPFRFYEN